MNGVKVLEQQNFTKKLISDRTLYDEQIFASPR